MSLATLNLNQCIQCGRCSGGCPVSIKSRLNVRMLVYTRLDRAFKPAELGELGVWECTTCTTCNERCPKQVNPASLVVELRSQLIESGRMASTVQAALESTYVQGNPWSRARENRLAWASDLNLKRVSDGNPAEYLLFVCCTNAYDERCQRTARALAEILTAAGIDFGVIGEDESCCASEQRRLGEEGLFDELANSNAATLRDLPVRTVITISPHCYNAFRNDYPDFQHEVIHYTQFLARLLAEGKLELDAAAFAARHDSLVTYHDPCFLGRQNKVFDEPRAVLQAVTGDRFIEFDRCRETSLCCEGGGGRMWLESEGTGRLAEVRVRDAVEMGAGVIATACPFCTLTLEDAVKTTNSDDKVSICDIAELVRECLPNMPPPADPAAASLRSAGTP
ncbi:MAG: (Fe-S)-binding protein [bacterium]